MMKVLTPISEQQKFCLHKEMMRVIQTQNKMDTGAFPEILWWIRIRSLQERQMADSVSDRLKCK